jgi:hypothetical protein
VLLMVSLLFGLSAGRWGSILRNLGHRPRRAAAGVLAIIPLGLQAQIVMAAASGRCCSIGYVIGAAPADLRVVG